VQSTHRDPVPERGEKPAPVPYTRAADRYGAEFQSAFHRHAESLDIKHVYIRPRTPHLNGKVERSHRIDDDEFYQLVDQNGVSEDIHLFNEKLREWEDYYNYHRPHGALQGQTPYERLIDKTRADVSQGS
jgi:transposase InsO family protein